MKRKFKQWFSTIPNIAKVGIKHQSINQYINQSTIPPLHQPLNARKALTWGIGNPGAGLGQVQKCLGIKPVTGKPSLIHGSPTAIQI